MKQVLLICLMMFSIQAMAQSDFDKSRDKENDAVVYKGKFSFDDLKKEESFGWLNRGADAYKPDSAAMKYLKKQLSEYEIVVLMGTWCEDSQNLIPPFYKVIQASGYPMNKLSMYGVDRAKEAKYVEHKLYKLERVPTIIVYKHHQEIGRIVETVKKSIEKDLAAMIEADLEASK